jgi:hypothetical protein
VAARGAIQLAGADGPGITAAFAATLRDLETALDAAPSEFVVAGPFGGISLDAYLETRVLEATVHGLDLAHALGEPAWRPPAAALRISLHLLTELALRRSEAARLLGMMTGRSWAEPAAVLR